MMIADGDFIIIRPLHYVNNVITNAMIVITLTLHALIAPKHLIIGLWLMVTVFLCLDILRTAQHKLLLAKIHVLNALIRLLNVQTAYLDII